MNISLFNKPKPAKTDSTIYFASFKEATQLQNLDENIKKAVLAKAKAKVNLFELNNGQSLIFGFYEKDENQHITNENIRILGSKIANYLNHLNYAKADVKGGNQSNQQLDNFLQGMALANYQFLKYKTEKEKNKLEKVYVEGNYSKKDATDLNNLVSAVYAARTMVNEPLNFLTATQLAKEAEKLGKDAGISVEIYGKKKIESLKMGGLLAVNLGSEDPPSFTIMEYKPKKAVNKKPYVMVGKGVVFDTGGLSLKPTKNSMDFMKCDMGGAAAVIGATYAIAKNKLPIHIITLVPATDNRPGKNAYVPSDVIKMYDGTTVEVMNTDAEGRMLLADALAFAKQYKPELTIDAATLTGSALRAVGEDTSVLCSTANESETQAMKNAGWATYERLIQLPLWKEYADDLKSSIADIKHLGGSSAGAIKAAKFLEHFTDYPWIHLDIAGPAWVHSKKKYLTTGGTGVGVRLLYHFFKQKAEA